MLQVMEGLGSQKLLYHGSHGIFIVMTFVDSFIPIKPSSIIWNKLSTNLYIRLYAIPEKAS